jgi:hypothetical protein
MRGVVDRENGRNVRRLMVRVVLDGYIGGV